MKMNRLILFCSCIVVYRRCVKGVDVTDIERVFPFMFNTSNPYNTEEGEMQEYLCSSNSDMRQCSCSPDCMKDKGCCIDAFWDNRNPMQLESYIEMFLNESKKRFVV